MRLLGSTLCSAVLAYVGAAVPVPTSSPSPEAKRLTRSTQLAEQVGRTVRLRGRFSGLGKLGPYLLFDGEGIYILAESSKDTTSEDTRLEGRTVEVAGLLRFRKYPPSPSVAPNVLQPARPPDHYYFDRSEATIVVVNDRE
jgi:hypothetical protein